VVRLGVKGGRRAIPIAVASFSRDSADSELHQIGEALSAVLLTDLRNSVRFEVLSDSGQVDSLNRANPLDRWSAAGARALIRGDLRRRSGRIELFATLYRLPDGRILIGKSYRADGDRVRRVAHRLSDDIVLSLTGQPGIATTRIAFVASRAGRKEIFAMDSDGHGIRPVTDDRTIDLSPAWSPDGRKIVYTSLQRGRWELFIADVLSGGTTPVRTSSGFNTAPAWSPDGKQILFCISDEDNIDLYAIAVSNWRLRRVTDHPEMDTEPSWSPDGQRIAFTSDRAAGVPQIFTMNYDGSGLRRLTWDPNAYEGSPRWSPDAKRIAFVQRGFEGFDVYVTEVEGGVPFRLTVGGSNENPTWSPDGLQIAFCSNRDGKDDIYVMNWDGSNPRRLTSGGGNTSPSWSPTVGDLSGEE
jgi:TolB protein